MQPIRIPNSIGHLAPPLHQNLDTKESRIPQTSTHHEVVTNGDTARLLSRRPILPQQDHSYDHIVRENLELREKMAMLEKCATKAWSSRRRSAPLTNNRKRRISKLPLIRLPPRTHEPRGGEQFKPSPDPKEDDLSHFMVSGPHLETYQRVGKDTSRRPMVRRSSAKSTQSRLSVTPAIGPGVAIVTRTSRIEDDVSIHENHSLSGILPLSIELPSITEFQLPNGSGSSGGCSYRTIHAEPLPFEIPRKKILPRADEASTAWDEPAELLQDQWGVFRPYTMLSSVPWSPPVPSGEGAKGQVKRNASPSNSGSGTHPRSRPRLFSVGPLDRTSSRSTRSSSCEQASPRVAVIPLAESMALMAKEIRLPSLIGLPLASPILQCWPADTRREAEAPIVPVTVLMDMTPRGGHSEETPPSEMTGIARCPSLGYRKITLGRRRKSFATKPDIKDCGDTGMLHDRHNWDRATSSHSLNSCSDDAMEIDL